MHMFSGMCGSGFTATSNIAGTISPGHLLPVTGFNIAITHTQTYFNETSEEKCSRFV